jgi:PHD/YefM family antitoxin component YafN of YafNO toxin-antitoxin module
MATTIQIDESTKKMLDKLKEHHRESYNELLKRMINSFSKTDKESLIETIEIMSNPETMRNIAKGIEDYKRGRGTRLEDFKRDLGL